MRIGWVLHPLLARIPIERRILVLKPSFEHGAGVVIMAMELAYLQWQHDESADQPVLEGERLLRSADLHLLQESLLVRILGAARDGSLQSSARPTVLLDAWAKWGDPKEMRDAVESRLRDDDAFIAFLKLLSGQVRSTGMSDRVSRVTITFDPKRLADFTDVDVAATRVDKILSRQDISRDDRTVLEAFTRGRKARLAGRDPLTSEYAILPT